MPAFSSWRFRARLIHGLSVLAALFGANLAHTVRAADTTSTITLAADRDDDDLDGKPDADEAPVSATARSSLFLVDSRFVGAKVRAESGGDHLRMIARDGTVVAWGAVVLRGAMLQGVSVGKAALVIDRPGAVIGLSVEVIGLGLREGSTPPRDLDLTKERASLERLPPERAPASVDDSYADFDALRAMLTVPVGAANAIDPRGVSVESVSAAGLSIDRLDSVSLASARCSTGQACFGSEPLRFVVDDVDRAHVLVEKRSVRAEVGGAIVLRYAGASQTIRVEGPRASPVGPMSRMRVSVRPFVVRLSAKGGPAVGGNDMGAMLAVRSELALASAVWGQCGITFGKVDAIDIKIVDPPTSYLVAFGDDLGLPASGGTVRVRIDGKPISSVISRGSSPLVAARAFAASVTHAGFSATVSPNVRIVPAAEGSVDVLVRSGALPSALARIEPVTGVLAADDASMTVRIGTVDLSDGLYHFGDMDSMSGTLEERTLVKAFDDGDPSTIELFFVSAFSGGDRIGESFIQNDMSSVRDLVLLDRAGVRARRMSSTLAHEIGHVLMNAPGHPDDYGLDTPTLLMDSDGADASPFGPRRLTIDECARAVRESGPKSREPLLTSWPLSPLKIVSKSSTH